MKYAIFLPHVLALLALSVLGCEFKANVQTGPKEPEKASFWVTHANHMSGPFMYSTREAILLPDGTSVVCVATLKDIWCKEVTDEGLH